MFYFILAVHLLLCVVLITLVLLQQGKGASAGAVFGGSSNTLFGATGANTVLTKVTTGVAVAFMLTSVILVRLYAGHVTVRTGTNNPLSGSVMDLPVAAAPAEEPVKPAADAATNPVAAASQSSAAPASSSAAAAPVAAAPQQAEKK